MRMRLRDVLTVSPEPFGIGLRGLVVDQGAAPLATNCGNLPTSDKAPDLLGAVGDDALLGDSIGCVQ